MLEAMKTRAALAAHPRSRGEHLSPVLDEVAGGGSSPLARGTCYLTLAVETSTRLIPARAGNIERTPPPMTLHPAHPRSRGEHTHGKPPPVMYRGSSPLARGTFRPIRPAYRHIRLIPARAGNIRKFQAPQNPATAHPRSRGEHGREIGDGMAKGGSSPLARGTSELRP